MADLWVPASEHNRRVEGQRQFVGQLLQQGELLQRVRHWNRELASIDRYVEVFKADDNARHPSLRPGFYHLVRRPPVGMPAIVCHEGPNGEFRDLDSSILQTLRNADMWNSERQRDAKKMAERAQKAQEREEEREREARVQEITDRLRSRSNASVLIGGKPWT